MAEYRDVAQNSDILKIANAIRAVTGYEGDMTIEDMPRILIESHFDEDVDTKVVQVTLDTLSADAPVVIDTIRDNDAKHLFLVMPVSKNDVAELKNFGPEQAMQYDPLTGQLKLVVKLSPADYEATVSLFIMHLVMKPDLENGAFYLGQTLDPVSLVKLEGIEEGANKVIRVFNSLTYGEEVAGAINAYFDTSASTRKAYEVVEMASPAGSPSDPPTEVKHIYVFMKTGDSVATSGYLVLDVQTGNVYAVKSDRTYVEYLVPVKQKKAHIDLTVYGEDVSVRSTGPEAINDYVRQHPELYYTQEEGIKNSIIDAVFDCHNEGQGNYTSNDVLVVVPVSVFEGDTQPFYVEVLFLNELIKVVVRLNTTAWSVIEYNEFTTGEKQKLDDLPLSKGAGVQSVKQTEAAASGKNASAFGTSTASGERSHAEGNLCVASGNQAHAEGSQSQATANQAHAEGFGCQAKGNGAHAENDETIAEGPYSHTEGEACKTTPNGRYGHAGGNDSIVNNEGAIAHGLGLRTAKGYAAYVGKYNNALAEDLFEVGNGTSDGDRGNAFRVKESGVAVGAKDPSLSSDGRFAFVTLGLMNTYREQLSLAFDGTKTPWQSIWNLLSQLPVNTRKYIASGVIALPGPFGGLPMTVTAVYKEGNYCYIKGYCLAGGGGILGVKDASIRIDSSYNVQSYDGDTLDLDNVHLEVGDGCLWF